MKDRGSRRTLLDDASSEDIKRLLHAGATIMDSRPLEDDAQKPVPGSLKIPQPKLLNSRAMTPKDKPVVTCPADNALPTTAARIVVAHGSKAVDGRAWGNGARLQEKP